VEVAAALIASAAAEQRPFALVAGGAVLEPGSGTAHMERALDILAKVDFAAEAAPPAPPVPAEVCVLVAVRAGAADGRGWGDTFVVGADARLGAAAVAA
jgi:hypothetical protein